MVEEGANRPGIEETLFQLLERGGAGGMDQGNLLILLSLVNLMGIVNTINYRMGNHKPVPERVPETAAGEKGPAFDPSPLLAMLGGKGRGPAGPGQLAGLIERFMGPPGGVPRGPAPVVAGGGPGPAPEGDAGKPDPGEGEKPGVRP